MKNILVLTDFSIRAQYAAEFALQIALKVKADILLCNVMEIIENAPMAEQLAWPIADHVALKQDNLKDLKKLATHLEKLMPAKGAIQDYKPEINCINDFGKLSVVAKRVVKEKMVDLVIMGSHRSTGLGRFLFGSHTYKVLDDVNCPVLFVPERLKFTEIRSMAYATDLTFSDFKVINYLAEIAKPFKAEILVSHISPYGLPGLDAAKAIQHSVNELLAQDHPKVFYTSIKGDITKRLLEISGSGKADVLAMVHKRYSFFEGLFHSSISKQMANTAKVALLILPYSFSVDAADLSNEQLDHYCYEPNDSR